MEAERRRARLTPLSGELKEMVEWQPPDPTKQEKPTRRRREKRAPTTRRGDDPARASAARAAADRVTGGGALIAWLVASALGTARSSTILPTVFYFAGAAVGAVAVLGGTGMGRSYRYGGYGWDAATPRQTAVNTSFFFGLLARVPVRPRARARLPALASSASPARSARRPRRGRRRPSRRRSAAPSGSCGCDGAARRASRPRAPTRRR